MAKSTMAKQTRRQPRASTSASATTDRAAIAGGLSRLLADTYTLYLTTHNFHWNVTGPMFNTLHLMFMTQYTELLERGRPGRRAHPLARASGARLAMRSSASSARSRTCRRRRRRRSRWCAILVEGHEAVARTARGIFPLAEKAGDEPTADLLTQRLAVHEQTAWMLRSLLED